MGFWDLGIWMDNGASLLKNGTLGKEQFANKWL